MVQSSRCRRLTQRQASPAIWVTDVMLCRAIEQYQRSALPSCRHLSSHRGPLESRRRLGRRNMTGFMLPSPMYRPLWHFEVLGSPTTWTWTPPTTAKVRREREKEVTLRSLSKKLVAWLEDSDLGKPFLQTPDEVALDTRTAEIEEAIQPIVDSSAATKAPFEIANLRDAIYRLEQIDETSLSRLRHECCAALGQRIRDGELSVDDLWSALDPVDSATRYRIPGRRVADNLSASIRKYLVSSIIDLRQQAQEGYSLSLWSALLARIFSLGPEDGTFRLFRQLMEFSTPADRYQIPFKEVLSMTRSFIATQASRHAMSSAWLLRTARFAQALQSLELSQRERLFNELGQSLRQQASDVDMARQVHLTWLLLVGHDTKATRAVFTVAAQDFANRYGTLKSSELWQIATARLFASGVLDAASHRALVQQGYQSMPQRWTALVLLAMNSGRETGLFELQECVRDLGRPSILGRSLTSHDLGQFSADALRAVEKILKDPKVDDGFVWEALQIRDNTAPRPTKQTNDRETRSKAQLLDKMAGWYLTSTHLTDRQVVRSIERCVSRHRRLTGQSSSVTLATLTQAVLRDLEQGQWGRSQRLEWVIKLVAKHHGVGEANKALVALNGWRSMIQKETPRSSK